ncbi:MAG: apolipoprotein N-acyltransferase [Kiritimatiellia bacterium]
MTPSARQMIRWAASGLAALASGLMIASGFAPWESVTTSWVALVPLLLLARFSTPRQAFGWGLLSGVATWATGLSWLLALHVTAGLPWPAIAAGWLGLSVYCALYTGVFAWAVCRWLAWTGTDRIWLNALSVFVIPMFWVGLEYIRGNLFTGFPWNPLGATQAQNPAIAQMAEWGGVYLVSGIVVLFNASVFFTVGRYVDWRNPKPYKPHVELFIGLLAMAVCTILGRSRFQHYGSEGGNLLVGLVQPAVPQNVKWDGQFADEVQNRLTQLTFEASETGLALTKKRPDLIIWPETSTPGDMARDSEYVSRLVGVAQECGPLLVGSIYEGETSLANSSILIQAPVSNAVSMTRYDKQHLVPFGEFIPLDKYFPSLQNLSPLGLSLTPGREATVFDLAGTGARFSVTICFEDVFPEIARDFVRRGARLLINQSNDAWFDGTAQHRQHLNLSLMRCIENRVPGVRVSNSGASACIEPNGRVYRGGLAPSEADGWLGLPGPLADEEVLSDVSFVNVPPAVMEPTVYNRYGDRLWAIPCAALTLAWILAAGWMDWKNKKEHRRE